MESNLQLKESFSGEVDCLDAEAHQPMAASPDGNLSSVLGFDRPSLNRGGDPRSSSYPIRNVGTNPLYQFEYILILGGRTAIENGLMVSNPVSPLAGEFDPLGHILSAQPLGQVRKRAVHSICPKDSPKPFGQKVLPETE